MGVAESVRGLQVMRHLSRQISVAAQRRRHSDSLRRRFLDPLMEARGRARKAEFMFSSPEWYSWLRSLFVLCSVISASETSANQQWGAS